MQETSQHHPHPYLTLLNVSQHNSLLLFASFNINCKSTCCNARMNISMHLWKCKTIACSQFNVPMLLPVATDCYIYRKRIRSLSLPRSLRQCNAHYNNFHENAFIVIHIYVYTELTSQWLRF